MKPESQPENLNKEMNENKKNSANKEMAENDCENQSQKSQSRLTGLFLKALNW